jgi:hypothetical protein
MAVRLSAPRTGRDLIPRNINFMLLILISVTGSVNPGALCGMENCGNWTFTDQTRKYTMLKYAYKFRTFRGTNYITSPCYTSEVGPSPHKFTHPPPCCKWIRTLRNNGVTMSFSGWNIFWYSFLVQAKSTPGCIVRMEALCTLRPSNNFIVNIALTLRLAA